MGINIFFKKSRKAPEKHYGETRWSRLFSRKNVYPEIRIHGPLLYTHSFNTPSSALIGEIDKLGRFTVYEEEKLVIVKDVHFPKSADYKLETF